jgi:hypothetical protein
MPVEIRAIRRSSISAKRKGPGDAVGTARGPDPSAGNFCTGAPANVFHASQAGQRPSQRADSKPHAPQKKALFTLATTAARNRQRAWTEQAGTRRDDTSMW